MIHLDFGTDPADWAVRGGKPAAILGEKGMASYEHEDGGLLVMDLLVAMAESNGGLMLLSRWYGTACILAPDGMVPLHHSPSARWDWRPLMYRASLFSAWQGLGSQQELAWRYGLCQVQHAIHAGAEFTMHEADDRAERLLLDNLTPQQRLDFRCYGHFFVRGAKTRNLYRVESSNGFDIVDEYTREVVVSYCLHPEEWIPHDDVALATKLALEDEDLELECLENARQRLRDYRARPTPDEVVAHRYERELEASCSP